MQEIVRRHFWKVVIILLVILAALFFAPRMRIPPPPTPPEVERGKASFYGGSFDGGLTANGETYDEDSLTGAHRTLPMGTMVRVKNLDNGREVTVRINNRGPFVKGRIIDLSTRAARELRMLDAGVVPVEVMVLVEPQPFAKN